MEVAVKIEDFYGVYLLCSQSPERKFNGCCYIGYTVNPNRRVKQHNRGHDHGGARKTNNKGPWKMVLIVHGFPNNISALQFEWAWQWPAKSSRLKNNENIAKKLRKETHFDYNFRILTHMLTIGPWNRLPLTIRWLEGDYFKELPADKILPLHIKIAHGTVSIKKKPNLITESEILRERLQECHLCMKMIEDPTRSKITCINSKCMLTCHIICLANQCLEPGHYIPIEGSCPICETSFLWGDLIRKKNGCNDLEEALEDHNDNDSDEVEFILDDLTFDEDA